MVKLITIKIEEEDLELLKKAASVAYNKEKHIKRYGYGSFMKEVALNRAKKILKA